MYYSNGNYEAFARPRKPAGVDRKHAYIVGAGLAGLSAAVFLIRDAQMPGENIHIFWESSLTMFRIFIKDNGCGIAAEDFYHIFKRFYRSLSSTERTGVGLGLPLAKAIVEGQGGILSVESEVGHGSVFCISLPL